MISHYAGFSNVPLIGTKGVINYNPVLALRQLGYAMRRPPTAKEVEPMYCKKGEDPELLKKVDWFQSLRGLVEGKSQNSYVAF